MKKIFFVVGENSGDSLAAKLIGELKSQTEDGVQCCGIGGPLMREQGFDELLPMDQISAIGIWEVIPKIPRLYKIFQALLQEIEDQNPDAVVTVDFPDFNFFLGRFLKKRGVYKGKLVHYVAPSVWAWRPGRAKKIASFLDGLICLFPMEVEPFTKHGLKTVYVGHPLVEAGIEDGDGQAFRDANDIPRDAKTVGLFFGSRESELNNMNAVLREAALLVDDVQKEDIHVIVPTLAKNEYILQNKLIGFKLPLYVSSNPDIKWDAFKACDVAIAVSGTVALELAYAGVPHVIGYKLSSITHLFLKILVRVKYIHLVNILLDKAVVPEFIQAQCTSLNIAHKANVLLTDEEERAKQIEAFKEIREIVGANKTQKPSEKAAAFILDTIGV